MQEIERFEFVRKVWPSDANFFLIEVDDANKVLRCCEEHRVLLRYFGGALASCIRISVGGADENTALLRALEALRES